jgi:outer membrane protein assembly factor BamB
VNPWPLEDRAVSVPETVQAPPRRRSFLRFWLPLILLALAGGTALVIWIWPDPETPLVFRWVFTQMAAALFLLLFTLWFVSFSGLRWWLRLGVVAAGVAALVLLPRFLIRDIHVSGNMLPVVHFVWERPQDEALATWRREHPTTALSAAIDVTGDRPTDYPGYRGRQRDAVVHGPALARDWKAPPRELWRHPCGGGYAGFAIAGNSAVTVEQRGDKEAVVCYDTDTGLERWVYDYPARFHDTTGMGGTGPRATPTIVDGEVYSLGADGHLVCLDAATGKSRWKEGADTAGAKDKIVNILEGNANVMWGISGSPLVYDRVVVVNPGKQQPSAKYGAVAAFDRKTGELVWKSGDTHAGYSSPMLATLAGKRQVLLFDYAGVAGYDAADGTKLWDFPWKTPHNEEIKVAQPLVLPGDRVFICSSYGNACAMLQVAAEESGKLAARQLWENPKTMRCRFSSPVADEHYLYGLDEGVLICLDAGTGARKWRGNRYDYGQLLRADDLLLIQAEDGDLALVEATGEAFHELGRFPALGGHTWNCPALADGMAYVRNDRVMACFDLRAPK